MFLNAIVSALIVSLVSLIGIMFLFFKKDKINSIVFVLVAFAAGALIGDAFFHIIPESLDAVNNMQFVFVVVIAGFLFFYLIENLIHWRHCHDEHCEEHGKKRFTYLNLIGESVHNFLDGVLIGVSYLVSVPIGVATTTAVVAHEIPHEIGNFGVLIYGGFSRLRALVFNLLSASLSILGVVFVYSGLFKASYSVFVLPVVAGGFLYISMSDLIPELHQHTETWKKILSFVFLIVGLVLMYYMKIWLS